MRCLIDGTGAAPYRKASSRSRATALPLSGRRERSRLERGAHEHDLKGRALSPGFIDTHTHDDRIVLDAPDMLPKISQGVTTVVTGNCGISLAPVTFAGDPPAPMNLLGVARRPTSSRPSPIMPRALAETVPGVNVAALIGHSALRLATMSDIRVKASDGGDRHDARPRRRGDGERRGGLFDRPVLSDQRGADIDEVSRVAARFAKHGGVYATHMRSEMEPSSNSIDETLATAKRADIPVVISHHKCAGPRTGAARRKRCR